MRRWCVIVCAAGLGSPMGPALAQPEDGPERSVAEEVAEKLSERVGDDDLVQLARELEAAVEAGEITREEADARMIEASMRKIAEDNRQRENERKRRVPDRFVFDAEAGRVAFEEWLDALASSGDPESDSWYVFASLHNDQRFASEFGQGDVGQPLGIALAHALESDPSLAAPRASRRSAIRALCMVELTEDELRDRAVREVLVSQLKHATELSSYVISNSLTRVPEDERALWYRPLSEHLRSDDYIRFIVGCDGISGLGVIAPDDRAFLLNVITDLRSASKPLGDSTYLDPFARSATPFQYWPRSRVRSAAASALLASAHDPAEVLESLGAVTGRARLDVACAIAKAFAGFQPVEAAAWDREAVERAFALLDEILAEPASKIIVVDPSARFWADVEYLRYGISILTDLITTMEIMGEHEYGTLAMRSALRAAYRHGDEELIASVAGTVRRHAPRVLDEVRRGPEVIEAGTDIVKLASELRRAVERGEITQEEMDRRLEDAAYERIRTP